MLNVVTENVVPKNSAAISFDALARDSLIGARLYLESQMLTILFSGDSQHQLLIK